MTNDQAPVSNDGQACASPWSSGFGRWSFPLGLFLGRQQPLRISVLLRLRRLRLRLRCRARGGPGAAGARVGNDLLVVAWATRSLIDHRLESGRRSPLVNLIGDRSLAIAQAGQSLIGRGF